MIKHCLAIFLAVSTILGAKDVRNLDILLHKRAVMEDAKLLKNLLAKGADPNCRAEWGEETPLMTAAADGRVEAVAALLDAGADIDAENKDGRSALIYAIDRKQHPCIYLLLARGAKIVVPKSRCNALVTAIEARDEGTVRRLLATEGVDVNLSNWDSTPLFAAAFDGQYALACELLKLGAQINAAKAEHSPLFGAVMSGDCRLVSLVASAGADLCQAADDGITALHLAVSNRNMEAARFLVERGVDVNARTEWGKTPLLIAAEQGETDIVRLLVSAGADVNSKNGTGHTALIAAAQSSVYPCVSFLLECGANTNASDEDGDTALHLAVSYSERSNISIVRLLVENGANPNAQSNRGETPLVRFAARGDSQSVAYLLPLTNLDLALASDYYE